MNEVLLTGHIIVGITAIAASLSKLIPGLSKIKVMFWPSTAVVAITGFALLFTGVPLGRVCFSAAALTAGIITINKFSAARRISSY